MKRTAIVLLVQLCGCASAAPDGPPARAPDWRNRSIRLGAPVCSDSIVALRSGTAAGLDSLRLFLGQTDLRTARVVATDSGVALANTRDVQRELIRNYPPALRDAGVGGLSVYFLVIDTVGEVTRARNIRSSGHLRLDQASAKVVSTIAVRPGARRRLQSNERRDRPGAVEFSGHDTSGFLVSSPS